MKFKDDINKIMKSIQVNDEMTNNILNNTIRNNKARKIGKRRVVALVMTVVLCIGSVAVGANQMTGFWNNLVDRYLKANGQEKTEMVGKGYVDTGAGKNVSTTADGITVSLLQTVADKNGMYIYLSVKSDAKLNGEMLFFNMVYARLEGKGRIEKSQDISLISDHEGILEIYAAAGLEEERLNIQGKKIEVTLENLHKVKTKNDKLQYETVVKGKWKLGWIGKSSMDSKVVELKGSLNQDDVTINLKRMEITPLSVKIEYSTSEWDSTEGPDWLDIPFTIVMKDGSKFRLRKDGSDEKGAVQDGYCTNIMFKKVLNIYNIEYVIVNGKKYNVR